MVTVGGMTLLAIPDIHGHKSELERVLRLADAQCGRDARIVFLGDLVDRGPDSRGVIQTLIDGVAAGRDWIVLRGNHDQAFLDFLREARRGGAGLRLGSGWLGGNMGGAETLRSYGVDLWAPEPDWPEAAAAIPADHHRFLEGLPVFHETDSLFFAHAGIRPGVPLAKQRPDDLIWIRHEFLWDHRDHGKLIVHGHTPVETPTHYGNRVNLDGGAGWGRPLQVALFEGRAAWRLTETGPIPLRRA